MIFEGEYFKDKRHGKGKIYNENNELAFEGEFYYSYKKSKRILWQES